ncbi:MAG: hypothetical protein ACLQMF_14810 [Rectinemataceae bacterium]
MQTREGERASGFEWKRCKIELLKKLVIYGLLTSIEITRFEFVSKRSPLIGLTRAMLTGILLKRFRAHLKLSLRGIPAAAKIIADPAVALIAADRGALASALTERSSWVSALRASVEAECAAAFAAAPLAGPEEEAERNKGMADLIEAIDDETWLLMALTGPELVAPVASMVQSYSTRLDIAETLTLMLMEFVQYAERSHLLNMAERDRYIRAHPEELDRLLSEPEFRDKLLERAVERGELIFIGISFTGTILDPSAPTTVEIRVRNRGLIGYVSRTEMLNRRIKVVKESSLDQILQEQERNDLGAGLGLFYLSNLEEACSQEGIAFHTSIQRDEFRDETISLMSVTI